MSKLIKPNRELTGVWEMCVFSGPNSQPSGLTEPLTLFLKWRPCDVHLAVEPPIPCSPSTQHHAWHEFMATLTHRPIHSSTHTSCLPAHPPIPHAYLPSCYAPTYPPIIHHLPTGLSLPTHPSPCLPTTHTPTVQVGF